jgi:hypothetical protein
MYSLDIAYSYCHYNLHCLVPFYCCLANCVFFPNTFTCMYYLVCRNTIALSNKKLIHLIYLFISSFSMPLSCMWTKIHKYVLHILKACSSCVEKCLTWFITNDSAMFVVLVASFKLFFALQTSFSNSENTHLQLPNRASGTFTIPFSYRRLHIS